MRVGKHVQRRRGQWSTSMCGRLAGLGSTVEHINPLRRDNGHRLDRNLMLPVLLRVSLTPGVLVAIVSDWLPLVEEEEAAAEVRATWRSSRHPRRDHDRGSLRQSGVGR